MTDIITEHSGSILRIELNRPAKRNAMTSGMYVGLADIFNDAAKDESTRVVLWHGAGESFSAGNDVDDFLKNPPARRAAELGFVTQVVPDQNLLATATETARKLAAKPPGALQASKRLMKRPFREQIKAAMKAENEEFSVQVRSEDAKEALKAFLEKRPPHFAGTIKSSAAA